MSTNTEELKVWTRVTPESVGPLMGRIPWTEGLVRWCIGWKDGPNSLMFDSERYEITANSEIPDCTLVTPNRFVKLVMEAMKK